MGARVAHLAGVLGAAVARCCLDQHMDPAAQPVTVQCQLRFSIADPLFSRLQPHLVGASRRTIRDIFGGDRVEHGKVMRFFASG